MAIFYSDTASFSYVNIEGGSGSALFNVSGSAGNLLTIFDSPADAFSISSGSINIFSIGSPQDVTISGSLTVNASTLLDVQSIAGFIDNKDGYVELYVQNLSTGISASTDIVAYANTGTESSSFIDMGINGSNTARGYNYGGPLDAYVYNTGGNLYIGNNTAFYQPNSPSQSVFLFSNANAIPEMVLTGSRVGIGKTGSLNATLDVNGNLIISGSLIVTQGITGSLSGSAGGGSGAGFPYSGSAVITGSLLVSGSGLTVTGSTALAGALSVVGAITSPTIDSLSNSISVLSQQNPVQSTEISQLQSVTDNVSAVAPGGAAQIGLQNAINALSNRISAIPGGATSVNPTRYVSVANTLATATLTGISGLTTSVSAGVIYEIEGQIMYSVSAATGNAFGLVWPTANRVAGVWQGGTSVNQTGASTFSTMAYGDFDTGDSNSAVWSAAVGITGLHFIKVDGIIDAQTTGPIYPVARSSAAANTLVIARGSYFRVARIN